MPTAASEPLMMRRGRAEVYEPGKQSMMMYGGVKLPPLASPVKSRSSAATDWKVGPLVVPSALFLELTISKYAYVLLEGFVYRRAQAFSESDFESSVRPSHAGPSPRLRRNFFSHG